MMASATLAASAETRRQRRRRPRFSLLGAVGALVITVGVIGILFVIWEVWWTGLDANSEAQATTDDYLTSLEPNDAEECLQLPDGTPIGCAEKMREAAADGETMGVLVAPRLGEDWRWPVKSGTGSEVLNSGALGHYEQTQLPDELGNMAIAGHRLTYGDPLRDQDALIPGDGLSLISADGTYVYEVYGSEVTTPQDIDVIAPAPGEPGLSPDRSVLTLTTCHPLWSNAERLITYAELVDFIPASDQPAMGSAAEASDTTLPGAVSESFISSHGEVVTR